MRMLGLLLAPLTWPAWGIEALSRRKGGVFEFGIVNSTPYFACWGLGATAVVVWSGNVWLAGAGLYILTMMELVALGISLMLAISRPGRIQTFMLEIAQRHRPNQLISVNVPAVYGSLVALGYAVWYFACVALYMHRHFAGFYSGVEARGPGLPLFWQFLYFSFTTVTTLGGHVQPATFPSELLVANEVCVGIFFFLFLLTAIVSRYLDELRQP